jgi:small GTP-binding protein
MKSLPLLKIMILGDGNVGKTSLVRRYCEGKFEMSRVLTIGVDFQTKKVQLPETMVKLSIWDVAGQNRFRAVRENMYRGTLAAVLVYDLTEPQSLENLPRWRDEIQQVVPLIDFLVVGNKLDLIEEREDLLDGKALADTLVAPHILTSALNGKGVKEMFLVLATIAHLRYQATLNR